MDETKLMPMQEQEFQLSKAGFDPKVREWQSAFRTKYGESPTMEGDPGFDYRKAFQAGNRPEMTQGDTVPHWPSTGKAEDHPTAWKQKFYDTFGADPDTVDAEKYTPEMKDWMRQYLPLPNLNELLLSITNDPRLLDVLSVLRRPTEEKR